MNIRTRSTYLCKNRKKHVYSTFYDFILTPNMKTAYENYITWLVKTSLITVDEALNSLSMNEHELLILLWSSVREAEYIRFKLRSNLNIHVCC